MHDESPPEWFTAPREAHARALVVGQRVRVRLSGECRLIPLPESYHATLSRVGHELWEDGQTGTISGIDGPDDGLAAQGHPYEVCLDERYPLGGGLYARWLNFAAEELEPLPLWLDETHEITFGPDRHTRIISVETIRQTSKDDTSAIDEALRAVAPSHDERPE